MSTEASDQFSALRTEAIAYAGLAELEARPTPGEKAETLARIIQHTFDDYYARSRRIPWLAKRAFEQRDWPRAVALSQERIAIFSTSIAKAVPILELTIRELDRAGGFWPMVEQRYRRMVAERYESDLALAYLSALRRRVYQSEWLPVPYDRGRAEGPRARPDFLRHFPLRGPVTPELVDRILAVPAINAPFRDRAGDAAAVAERINAELDLGAATEARVEVVEAGFYRNRGAYIVGAIETGARTHPLALALLNGPDGVYVDAVILREPTLRHVFSSTLANFHVTVTAYHELVDYLHGLMPTRPRGLHYSTVGYNHVGKLAVMEQITEGLAAADEHLSVAPGPPGSVAIAFTAPGIGYVGKVIRDTPAASYKWRSYAGVPSVLAKYRRVHELNRSGSMLDNIIYANLSLPVALFDPSLLDALLSAAEGSVSLYRDQIFFRHLIVQRKLIPVPLYLAECTPEEAEMVVIRLGQCIRNNAAINVFNKDLDGRNYGVSSLRFVYLFDYDAVEPLTDIKVRTNADRFEGEEDVPDWFFEDGPVFLPEELETHLRLPGRSLRRLFRAAHGALLTADYWRRMQALLGEGRVPRVRTYPRSVQLDRDQKSENIILSRPG